ncbi:DUF6271 family protein [Streptomyces sp. C11-1]|uniref:DUF6271 family protein n=1 Tax=Streptomyces durocortorensis TaxID=2811104 RepID=A0ABY9VZ74_9ACTN|nr:DUF6271 family protein [Streptomyces durocortorensis]WNF28101.1 DUF6271 family protein [Streptomyces durocortorensis]
MRRICLALPTNRPCAKTLSAVGAEADHAAEHFGVEVHLLILDSSDRRTFQEHAGVLAAEHRAANVHVHHLDEAAQRDFLRLVLERSGATAPDRLLDLMLPPDVSYGACTNRAFLIAGALGCESVHRRDSDSAFQVQEDGTPVHPVHHELTSLGRRARDAADGVTETRLDPSDADKPVVLVGSSFVGELSVDIGEVQRLDPEIYYDIVSLWAPPEWPESRKRELVEESFRGAGTEPFRQDHALLTVVDPMRVDMCNISLHREVYENVPLPPAVNTIGSDYFLLHLVHDARLPGVLHNRNIVNFYTPERRTDAGFSAYHRRLVKFFLSMLYFNDIYDRMAAAGGALLDGDGLLRPAETARLVRESTRLDRSGNVHRLEVLDRSYRGLGGRYTEFAGLLEEEGKRLLDEACEDIEDFAFLIESWGEMVRASRTVRLHGAPGPSGPGL